MGWNYRVVKQKSSGIKDKKTKKYKIKPEWFWSIREVYYDKKGKVENWSTEPMRPRGETYISLLKDYTMFLWAFRLPVFVERGKKLTEEKKNQFWDD